MGLFSTTHIHQNSKEYVPYCKSVTVKEIKAPTDESVSLLNELTNKARRNIIATITIDENYLKGIAIYYRDELVSNRVVFYIKFGLNGREYIMEHKIDKFEWTAELAKTYIGLGNKQIFEMVHKKLSEIIANNLMEGCPEFLNAITK